MCPEPMRFGWDHCYFKCLRVARTGGHWLPLPVAQVATPRAGSPTCSQNIDTGGAHASPEVKLSRSQNGVPVAPMREGNRTNGRQVLQGFCLPFGAGHTATRGCFQPSPMGHTWAPFREVARHRGKSQLPGSALHSELCDPGKSKTLSEPQWLLL